MTNFLRSATNRWIHARTHTARLLRLEKNGTFHTAPDWKVPLQIHCSQPTSSLPRQNIAGGQRKVVGAEGWRQPV